MPNILVGVKVATDEAKAKLQELIRTTNAASSSGGVLGGVLSGIGAGVGIVGVMGVTNAVSTLTNVLGDAVAAAREDEVSVRQLGVALRDNVPAWDGQTGAIERTVLARQRLGFEDTALRGSLATLSSVTHDVNRALELQALAMDIARFRGIDLASATDMVAKASAGSLKALNAAIPATRGAKDAQEALTLAIAATAGQAEAYADTSLGKMEAAQIRVGESTERLGARIMPLLADAMDLAAGSVDLLVTTIDGLTVPLQTAEARSWDTGEAIQTVGYQAGWAAGQVDIYTRAATNAAGAAYDMADADKAAFLAERAVGDAAGDAVTPIQSKADADKAAAAAAWIAAVNSATATNAYVNQGRAALWAAEKVDILSDASRGADMTARIAASGAWTATTAYYAQAAGLTRAGMGANAHDERLKDLTVTTGGATRATRDFSEAVGKAFDALRTKVTRAFDAIHEKNLRYIEDTRKAANAPYTAQIAALTAEIAAIEADLKAKRDAARQADLERAVAEATTAQELADAQAALAEFKAEQVIAAKEAELAKAEAAVEANDKVAADAVAAEEARDKKQRENFERELTALETHLANKQTTWKKANDDLLALLDKYDLDFEAVGKKMGTAYASGYTKGVNSALKSIAAAVAKLLGLDEVTIRRLATTGTATPNTSAAPTAASGGAVPATTAPTMSTAPATTQNSTATATQGANTYVVNIYAGAFTGTDADAKKWATVMWTYFNDETIRRRDVWPAQADWDRVKNAVGI